MPTLLTSSPDIATVADLLERLGGIPPERVRYYPMPGTATEADTYVLGKDFPRIAEIVLDTSDDGRYVLATVQNGDGGEFASFVHGMMGSIHELSITPQVMSMC